MDAVIKIKPTPACSEDDRILLGLFKMTAFKPGLYLYVIQKEFGELTLSELKVLARPLLKLQSENMAINRTGLFCFDRQRKVL